MRHKKYDDNSASEQMLGMFEQMMKAQTDVAKLKPTFCGELDYLVRKGAKDRFETVDVYYTECGTFSIVRDKNDGQEYTIEIKPRKADK